MHPGVLTSFSLPENFYADDVKAIYPSTLERYGAREWKIVVMTNEIHGHLGIYSTIGAKMGVEIMDLARERGFHEEPQALSYAGLVPPVSCFNDGLQISTGATIGHGLIKIADDGSPARVEAEFIFSEEGKSLIITARLKDEFQEMIRGDIRRGVALYGHRPEYWAYVRTLALRYWSAWDRHDIFDITISDDAL